MPRASVWLIRAALVHLLSGAMLGAAYLIWKASGWPAFALTHLGVHQEQLLVGWVVQLVMGVGFWILPRRPDRDARADGRLMIAVFILLNAGVLAAGLGNAPSVPPVLFTVGRAAEATAAVLFALHAWNRQRPFSPGARKVLV